MRANVVERTMTRFLRRPPSVRGAASVIVIVTTVLVIGGGILVRVLDHEEYSNVWVGMWWSLQTVTTVGYGDVTPAHRSGRIIAAFVMLEGIAFVTIAVAAVTSIFIARATKEREITAAVTDDEASERIEARLDAIE